MLILIFPECADTSLLQYGIITMMLQHILKASLLQDRIVMMMRQHILEMWWSINIVL